LLLLLLLGRREKKNDDSAWNCRDHFRCCRCHASRHITSTGRGWVGGG
jgi:hypothetical protein